MAYGRAFPVALGEALTHRLRRADALLLNFDGGIYEPGKAMCSGLGAHRLLLGPDGFRRFQVGRYLASILPESSLARLRALFEGTRDPVTTALVPLIRGLISELDPPPALEPRSLSTFDRNLGVRLGLLLEQPLSKPHVLRLFVLAATLGLVLKVYGVGRPGGRPVLLALPNDAGLNGRKYARQEAVQALALGQAVLDEAIARMLPAHPLAGELWSQPPASTFGAFRVEEARSLEAAALALVARARKEGLGKKDLYWPDQFAMAFGRKAGVILPRRDQGGWGKHVALTPDLLEAIVLMFVAAGARPVRWEDLWQQVYEDLGLLVGANPHDDFLRLREIGVVQMDLQGIDAVGSTMLELAVRRGVAQRLPDSGAEVGGELR